jgi:hypothetical protein
MSLVLNAYKTDQRSAAATYDPMNGDFVLSTDRTRTYPLVADPVLSKFGFSPEYLHGMLTQYGQTLDALFANENPKRYLFFDFKTGGAVSPLTADALAKRMGRMMQQLTGKLVQSQMFRTLFLSWFDSQRPSMQEREHIAEWMQHSVERQMDTYSKKNPDHQIGDKRHRIEEPSQEGGQKRRCGLTVAELCS